MKCAIYARVSTDEQGTSIINQQEYFKDYITRNNFEIFDIYSDEAFSGTETTKRLSFQRLLEDGKNKRYDVLLAKSYSRFGRNQRETLTALAELFESGIRIVFVEDGLDSLRDKGQFGLFAWLAEQESRKISERIKMTWQLYNKEGKVHNTTETYGYNYDKSIKSFVVNEEEAESVRMIFDMYLRGDGTRKIAIFLNEGGYPTKRGGTWHSTHICKIIRNEFYLGHLIQGKLQKVDVVLKKVENVDRSKWIIHKNHHPAIVDEETFYKAQEEYKKRSDYLKQFNPVRHSTKHLFSNLVKCNICGDTCVARRKWSRNPDMCYSCKSYEALGKQVCGHSRNCINEDVLLFNVKSALEMLAENNYRIIRDYYNHNSADKLREKAKVNIAILDKQIEEQTYLGNSLLSLFAEGIIGKEQFKLQNDAIAVKLTALMAQREEALLE
jgi:DNA invertase Pin-like site-specific DNA recombinase